MINRRSYLPPPTTSPTARCKCRSWCTALHKATRKGWPLGATRFGCWRNQEPSPSRFVAWALPRLPSICESRWVGQGWASCVGVECTGSALRHIGWFYRGDRLARLCFRGRECPSAWVCWSSPGWPALTQWFTIFTPLRGSYWSRWVQRSYSLWLRRRAYRSMAG